MKITYALAALALITTSATAQDSTATPWKREVIKSATLGEDRPIIIVTPDGYDANRTRRYPVLVLLDANDAPQFRAAVANAAFLASRNNVEPLIIVGVPNGKDRTHDLTPVDIGAARQFKTAGGAASFATFLVDELLPYIRSQYRTQRMTMLAGHSFGGMFALHVAASRPAAFQGIIAMSPSLWWNDSTSANAYADSIARVAAPRLFVTSGALEPPIDVTTRRFAARLDSIKSVSLAFTYRRYTDNDHGLTPAPSLSEGLRFMFEPVSMQKLPVAQIAPGTDSASIVRLLAETDREYARGARALGLPEVLPEDVLNRVGYFVLNVFKKPEFATTLFRRNVARYPESANVYDSLADALIAKGDTASARVELRRAVDVATRTGHPVLAESRSKLQALESAAQAGTRRP